MTLTDILTAHRLDLAYRVGDGKTVVQAQCSDPYCDWHGNFTTGAEASDAHAVHVVEEMAAANIVAIELPEVDAYPHGEIEWGFASQGSDGWVNLDKGVITFDLAEDDGGETDGLPTVAEGRVPADLVKPFATALLAAAVRSTPTPGETP